jgi:hypothetical protein
LTCVASRLSYRTGTSLSQDVEGVRIKKVDANYGKPQST